MESGTNFGTKFSVAQNRDIPRCRFHAEAIAVAWRGLALTLPCFARAPYKYKIRPRDARERSRWITTHVTLIHAGMPAPISTSAFPYPAIRHPSKGAAPNVAPVHISQGANGLIGEGA